MKLETFTYTGTGAAKTVNLSEITGTPDFIFVKQWGSRYGAYRMTGMTDSQRLGAQTAKSDSITAINAGSFNVGVDNEVNELGFDYYGVAIYDDGAGDFEVGSVTGDVNETQNKATGLSNLEAVWVFPDNASSSHMGIHALSMGGTTDATKLLSGASLALQTGYITDISTVAGQFTLGASYNSELLVYRYLAFSPVSGYIDSLRYAGDQGVPDNPRSVDVDDNNSGKTPQFGMIMAADSSRSAVWRLTENVSGDCFKFDPSNTINGRFDDFGAETFTVVNSDDTNGIGINYDTFWLVNVVKQADVDFITSGSTIYSPSVILDQSIAADHIGTGNAQYEPTVVLTVNDVDADFIPSESALYEPFIFNYDSIASTSVQYEPGYTGDYELTIGFIEAINALYSPALTTTGQTVGLNFISAGSALYEPSITNDITRSIDGQSSLTIESNYQSKTLYYNGSYFTIN